MIEIDLQGSCWEGFKGQLFAALRHEFAASYPCGSETHLVQLGGGAIPPPEQDCTILLCRNGFNQPLPKRPPRPLAVGVLQSDDLAAARVLSRWGIPAISCGMAVTDTLTFSSFTSESAVVCLQRSTPALDGSVTEPSEIPLRLSRPCDRFTLMCIVAVYLLSGNWERLKNAML